MLNPDGTACQGAPGWPDFATTWMGTTTMYPTGRGQDRRPASGWHLPRLRPQFQPGDARVHVLPGCPVSTGPGLRCHVPLLPGGRAVSVRVTANPSGELPGTVIGRPYSLPAFLMCTMGERFCGKRWTARTETEFLLMSAERREHEADCRGGLIVAGR